MIKRPSELISERMMLLNKGRILRGSIAQDENETLCRRPASMCRAEGRKEGDENGK